MASMWIIRVTFIMDKDHILFCTQLSIEIVNVNSVAIFNAFHDCFFHTIIDVSNCRWGVGGMRFVFGIRVAFNTVRKWIKWYYVSTY